MIVNVDKYILDLYVCCYPEKNNVYNSIKIIHLRFYLNFLVFSSRVLFFPCNSAWEILTKFLSAYFSSLVHYMNTGHILSPYVSSKPFFLHTRWSHLSTNVHSTMLRSPLSNKEIFLLYLSLSNDFKDKRYKHICWSDLNKKSLFFEVHNNYHHP